MLIWIFCGGSLKLITIIFSYFCEFSFGVLLLYIKKIGIKSGFIREKTNIKVMRSGVSGKREQRKSLRKSTKKITKADIAGK